MSSVSVRLRWFEAVMFCDDPRIDAVTIAVAAALFKHMNAAGCCEVGVRRLRMLAHCGKNTVTNRAELLEEIGLLAIKRESGALNQYSAIPPNCPSWRDISKQLRDKSKGLRGRSECLTIYSP